MRSCVTSADRDQRRKRDLAAIHKLAAQLGMDTSDRNPHSEYRQMLLREGGASSAADLDGSGRSRVIGHLAKLVNPQGGRGRSLSPAEYIDVLWRQLGDAGRLRNATASGLSDFVHRMTGNHLVRSLTAAQATKVIEALKAWRARDDAPGR